MQTCALKNPDWLWRCTGLVLVFTILVSACSLDFGGDSGSSSPPASTPRANAQPTPVSTDIRPGIEPCPDAVKDQAHWHAVVDVGTGQTLEHVLCGHLMGTPALQAVVTVRHAGASRTLDVHIYTNITKVNPTSIFTRRGLSIRRPDDGPAGHEDRGHCARRDRHAPSRLTGSVVHQRECQVWKKLPIRRRRKSERKAEQKEASHEAKSVSIRPDRRAVGAVGTLDPSTAR